jgi:hypothetical protein
VSGAGGATRGRILVGGAIALALVLVGVYLAAGGASYEPQKAQDPCDPRPWRDPEGLQQIAEQFSLSALDGAACELGVTRETLARALATPEARERFGREYGIDEERLAEAVRAGLIRAVDDAEEAGALTPLLAGPLRSTLEEIPLEQAIALINDASDLLENVEGFLGPARDFLEGFFQ